MGCSCRVTPLRIFVQGLAQVHHVESSFLRSRSSAVSSTLLRSRFAALHQSRYLHNTITLRSEDAAVEKPISSEPTEKVSSNPSEPSPTEPEDSVRIPFKKSQDKPRRPKPNFQGERTSRSKFSSERPPSGRYSSDKFSKEAGFNDREFKKPREFGNKPFSKKPVPIDPDAPKPEKPHWRIQKEALKEKFPEGWNPRKRLSPDALAGIRALNAQFPDVYTTEALAKKFEVSPENIRRILRSKWTPSVEEEQSRQERWFRRGKNVWETQAALGKKPPRKWRQEGVTRDPSYHAWKQEASRKNREFENQEKDMHRSTWQRRSGGST